MVSGIMSAKTSKSFEGNTAETIKYGKKIRALGSINLFITSTNTRFIKNNPIAPNA